MAAFAIAVLGAVFVVTGNNSVSASLRDEFVGAYQVSDPAAGEVVEVHLRAEASSVDIVGVETSDVWTYNGSVPGPEIRLRLGETLRATLENALPEPTSIHWHGVRVPNAMDGVPGVNQDPVAPGQTFVYEFTPPDAGTFWFHSHTRGGEQLERGLYGSLIVEEPGPPIYSQDVVWIVDDWLLAADGQLIGDFNEPHDVTHNGRWGNVVTANSEISPELRGAPGERIRLRMINSSNARTYAPEFGDLDAMIVAVDGMLVGEPFPANRFVLAPGNRIDIDLIIKELAEPVVIFDNFNGEGFVIGTVVSAGDPVSTPDFPAPRNPNVPTWSAAVDADTDHTYALSLGQRSSGAPEWRFNGAAFPGGETAKLTQGEFVKIRLLNDSQMLHPIHLHGQFFKVVSRNGESVDEEHFRDTVLLMPGEVVDIGMVPLDTGTWAMHCHIQEHADAGMMTTFRVD